VSYLVYLVAAFLNAAYTSDIIVDIYTFPFAFN